eukprot:7087748-Pyramimonas_sp.AAC.1
MASCILNILNANWSGVVDDLRVIGILPEIASVWTNDAGERIAFEAGTVGSWVDLTDEDFKVRRLYRHCTAVLLLDCDCDQCCPLATWQWRAPL